MCRLCGKAGVGCTTSLGRWYGWGVRRRWLWRREMAHGRGGGGGGDGGELTEAAAGVGGDVARDARWRLLRLQRGGAVRGVALRQCSQRRTRVETGSGTGRWLLTRWVVVAAETVVAGGELGGVLYVVRETWVSAGT